MRLRERSAVADLPGVEDGDVGEESLGEPSSSGEREALRGKARHLSNRFLERHDPVFTNVLSQDPSKGAIGARVRTAGGELALGRESGAVGSGHALRMREHPGGRLLLHTEADHPHLIVLLDQKRSRVEERVEAALLHDLGDGFPLERLVLLERHGRDHHTVPRAEKRHLLFHRRSNPPPVVLVLQSLQKGFGSALAAPERHEVRERGAVGDVGISIQGDPDPALFRLLDNVEDRVELSPISLSLALEVRDMEPHPRPLGDGDRFLDRFEHAIVFVPHVSRVEPDRPAHRFRELRDLGERSKAARCVLEPARDAEGAPRESGPRETPHRFDLVARRGSIRHPEHQSADGPLPDERSRVESDPFRFELEELVRKDRGLVGVSIHSQNLGGDALANLALRLRIHEKLVLAMGMDVDEPGTHHEAPRVQNPRGRRAIEVGDGSDGLPPDADVASNRGLAAPVHHGASPDDHVEVALLAAPGKP